MKRAFTIVELVIVIAVIGILAGLVTFAYTGITQSAKEVSIKSDLEGAAGLLERANQRNNGYPSSISEITFTPSPGNTSKYASSGSLFCLEMSNPSVEQVYSYKSTEHKVSEGPCELIVSTYAGSTTGDAPGPLLSARLSIPVGITSFGDDLFVADIGNSRIVKMSGGQVSYFAGQGGPGGYSEGTGAAARFNLPTGLTADSNGNIYVADVGNNRIRKITPAGVVTTFAGSGVAGFANGTGAAAQFSAPSSVVASSTNNIYVADAGNYRIRKITPAGVVTTLAGSGVSGYLDGTGVAARFGAVARLAIGPSGNLYAADTGSLRIRKITPTGVVTTLAGSGTSGVVDGSATTARFTSGMSGIYVDRSEAVYVTESSGYIRKVLPTGEVSTLSGTGATASTDGPVSSAAFGWPYGIYGTSDGSLYVSEYWSSKIRKIY